jgi:uncharacterized damage-inducible protein DinB
MHNSTDLLDLHSRGHRSLQGLMRHCGLLSPEEFERELPGFGYPKVQQQLDHVIGAEEYWIQVLLGRYADDLTEVIHPTLEALAAYREEVAAVTEEYLRQADEAELNTAREMRIWPGSVRALVPAQVFIRTLTHIYQHQGQILAMCRLLGKPGTGGLDFPLT